MGVPKFFRYISERYPCLSELVKEYQIPEFDNLYLDMNGIIHMCSHPDDYDPHFRISEEKIFSDIFHYIEILFRMIKPQKLFFMAVDGVAPRAKMNQQRGRRFRSAKEAEVLEAKAKEKGEELPKEARFDSNCITPGTVFMARLHEQLKYFVSNKISTDKLWQKCKIILSGHETPGEGEHKIMDYIRYMKAQPGYDPNTRHCLYGLDADLIMLGLCTHEPHFSLLREEVRFGKKAKRKNIPEQITFYLLHLSLMRQYLELEFLPLKETLPFEYDMEKIIDDWVLMGFLVGNDFIPHLPNLHIANGALPILYNAYMKILPSLDGYINEFGHLNLDRFEKFMAALAAIDMEHFSGQYADLKYFQSKTGRRPNEKERTSYKLKDLEVWHPDESVNTDKVETKTTNKDLAALIKSTDDMLLDDGFNCATDDDKTTEIKLLSNPELQVVAKVGDLINISEDSNENSAKISSSSLLEALTKENENIEQAIEATEELDKKSQVIEPSDSNLKDLALDELEMNEDDEDVLSPYYSDTDSEEDCELMNAEFIQHKNDYYMNKLDYTKVTPQVMRDQAEGYVRAIQWNLHYYYNGVCSWSWYYPHHYAPYISDIKDFANLKLEYELGSPFKPFEQLLAVLPAASKTLLPEPYQELMISEQSPIIDYYPQDFRTDLNGKKQEWEAVVLIPFIAEDMLLKAMGPCNQRLSEDEKKRNSHGPMLLYEYTPTDLGAYKAPDYYPTIEFNHAKLTPLTIEDIRVPIEKLVKGLCPGAINEVYYPGFPTMKHLKYQGRLEKAKVKVFDTPSQNENMIVKIIPESKYDIEDLARKILGRTVHVAWPHLVEGLVVSVSDTQCRYHKSSIPGNFHLEVNKGNLIQLWHSQKQGIISHYKEKLGIDVEDTNILIHVKQITGQKYSYTSGGRISLEKQWANVESCYPVQSVIQNLIVYEPKGKKYETIQDLFPLGSKCFMLGHPHYGSIGVVTDNTSLKSGRIKVSMQVYPEPDMSCIYQFEQEVKYMHGSAAAQRLAITSHLLSRITGCIFAVPGVKGNSLPKNSSKMNIGLNLKLNKKNEEIPGYTKKVEGQWLYTQKSIHLVRDYMQFCPELFNYLSSHLGNDIFYESELFPNNIGEGKIQKIVDWIKQQPFSSVERQKVGSKMIDPTIVQKIEETVDSFKAANPPMKTVVMQIKPHLLFKPEVQTGNLLPDNTATYQLYDRIVNIREAYTVPFGCKGTVIGIQGPTNSGEDDLDVMLDVVFDEAFPGGLQLNCSPNRGYRVPKTAVINISHGMRSLQQKSVNSVTVSNSSWQQNKNSPQYNNSVQSQNSAFASWTPNPQNQTQNSSYHYRPNVAHVPHHQQQQQPRMILPSHGQPQQIFTPALNHHRMPIAPPAATAQPLHQRLQPAPTPQHGNQPVSAEFLAFFQDLQKNQDKNKLPSTLPPPLMEQKLSPKSVAFAHSPKSPQQLKKDPTEETEALKKLLNISAKHSPKKSASTSCAQKNISQHISVQDLFTHARNKEQKLIQQSPPKSAGYTVQLLHYCQTQGIGVPRYCYFPSNNNRIRAQVTLQDGRMVIGDESTSREDAAEMAAKVIINDIAQMKSFSSPKPHYSQRHQLNSNDPGNPKIFPVPPKQWYQKPNQQKLYKQNNSNIAQSQSRPQQQSQPQLLAKSLYINQVQKDLGKSSEKQATSFVPLQAVKKQRNKSINETNDMNPKKENSALNININDNVDKNKSITASSKNTQLHPQSSTSTTPKQKQRRSRIAANFSGLQGQK